MAGIGGHIVAFNNSSEATSQQEFDPLATAQIRKIIVWRLGWGNRRSTRRNPLGCAKIISAAGGMVSRVAHNHD